MIINIWLLFDDIIMWIFPLKSRGGPTDNLQMLNGNHVDKHQFVLCEMDMTLTFDIHLGVSLRDAIML